VLGTAVGGDLRTIGHAVVPDHAGNPQSIVREQLAAADGLRATMGFEIPWKIMLRVLPNYAGGRHAVLAATPEPHFG
jgi:hypothetical protein